MTYNVSHNLIKMIKEALFSGSKINLAILFNVAELV